MTISTVATIGAQIDFEWRIDLAGYELVKTDRRVHVPPESRVVSLAVSFLDSVEPSVFIRPLGGGDRHYRPLEDRPGLFLEFAECADTDALAFSNKYGLLTDSARTVDYWVDHRQKMRRFVDLIAICDIVNKNRLSLIPDFNDNYSPTMLGRIYRRTGKRSPAFRFVPRTLIAGMWIQASTSITGNQRYRSCKNCATWFPYGAPSGNRADKKWCSHRCRKAWARANKGEAK